MALALPAGAHLGCGRAATGPGASGAPFRLRVERVAPAPGAPEVGAPDTLRIDLRGPGGELLEHPPLLALAPGETHFEVPLFGRVGTDRQLTILFLGSRDVVHLDGASTTPARGILYLDRITGIEMKPGVIPRVTARVHLFVPQTLGVDPLPEGRHRLRWASIVGADRYRVTRFDGAGARSDTTLSDTTLVAAAGWRVFRVAAIDAATSLAGPPGDDVSAATLTRGIGVDASNPLRLD